MSIIEDIRKIEAHYFGVYVLLFLSIFAPGFLLLYIYKPELLASLGTVKILIFSASLSLPIAAINTFLVPISEPNEGSKFEDSLLLGALYSFIGLYAVIFISYLFSLSFKQFVIGIAIFEFILLIGVLIVRQREKKKNT